MVEFRNALAGHRERILPILIAISLVAGVVVSIFSAINAHADYYTGCGYGYNTNGTGFGYFPSSTGHGYGYVSGGAFGYGYGNQVCLLAITTTSPLPSGSTASSYSVQFGGTGGLVPYSWSETGTMPNGLTLSSGGLLSGTPISAGTSSFTVTMTDANGQPVSSVFSLTTTTPSSGATTTSPTTSTTTTSSTTTTTVAPTTTTTPPPTPGEPGLIFMHVVRTVSNGTQIQFKCTNAANCRATVRLVVRERTRTARGFRMVNTVVGQTGFSLGRGHTATKFVPFNRIGLARYGVTFHFTHGVRLQLWTSVVGGHNHSLYITLRR